MKRYLCCVYFIPDLGKCGQGDWLIHKDLMLVSVCENGITIRKRSCGSLQCDIPTISIRSILATSAIIVKIVTTTDIQLALEFNDPASLNALLQKLTQCRISYQVLGSAMGTTTDIFPDLMDPTVREVIARLIFSEGFAKFVQELEDTLVLPKMHPPSN